jgi:hypothetical protein
VGKLQWEFYYGVDGLAWGKTSLPVRNDEIAENSPYLNITFKPNNPTIIVITPQIARTTVSTIVPKSSSTEKFRIVFVVYLASFDELRLFTTTKYDGSAISNNITVIGIIIALDNFLSRTIILYSLSFYNFLYWEKPDKKENQFSVTSKSDFLLESPIRFISEFYTCKLLNGDRLITICHPHYLRLICFHQTVSFFDGELLL